MDYCYSCVMKNPSPLTTKDSKTHTMTSSGRQLASESLSDGEKRRVDTRIASQFPVQVNGVEGKSRDISASGIYFEIDENNNVGSKIQFSVQLDTPGGPINLVCEGEVVRLEKRDGKLGIAAKILSQSLKSA